MNAGEVTSRIEAYVREHFNISSRDDRFGPAVDLFEGGYVDSIGLVELLAFIESEFGVQIPDEDLMSDAFATLEGIGRIVCERAA